MVMVYAAVTMMSVSYNKPSQYDQWHLICRIAKIKLEQLKVISEGKADFNIKLE